MGVRTRGGILSAVTRVEKYVEEITEEELTLSFARINLESQLKIVTAMQEKYTAVQAQIISVQETPQKRKAEEEARDAFNLRCDVLIETLQSIIADLPGTSGGESKHDPSISSGMMKFMATILQQSEFRHQQQMDLLLSSLATPPVTVTALPRPAVCKLPQMSMPTFDGKFSSWCSFKDRFTASVLNYPGISDCQKMDYLQGAVQGDAKSAIRHLGITDGNFDVAWKILVDKFERKNEIVAEHVRTFFAMPKVTSSSPNAIHDITNLLSECTMALDAMSVTNRDPWLIQFVLDRLDSESRVLWGRECGSEVPTLPKFMAFLNQRCVDNKNSSPPSAKPNSSETSSRLNTGRSSIQKKSANALATSAASSASCRCCQETAHPLYKCPKFLGLDADGRFQVIKQLSLCRNCFASHMTSSCTFHKCQKCHGKHNILLHDKFSSSSEARTEGNPPATHPATSSTTTSTSTPSLTDSSKAPTVLAISSGLENLASEAPPKVFLATALVNILTSTGDTISCRVVLDGAAQVNIMTTNLYDQLNLPKFPTKISICGVNDGRSRAKFYVNTTIFSRFTDASFTFRAFVLPKVSGDIPNWEVNSAAINLPPGIPLADPSWSVQHPVDLLLCGNPYWASWLTGVIHLGPGLPMLRETVFGHVVVGEHEPIPPPEADSFACFNTLALDETLLRFWELESVPIDDSITDDHRAAEQHFISTYSRSEEGRFIVKLPFKENPNVLGDSRPLAVRQLLALERRFERNPDMRKLYNEVMEEQLRNRWIEPVPEDSCSAPAFYMPHHGVFKISTTTKLRVVFNASAKSSSGVSLNNILRVGPTVQPKLAAILLRFRRHPFAMTADISKMYLQLLMDPADANFQRFVYRSDKSQPIQDFRVARVCFGVASSPFLATRALLQLARDHETSHPLAAEALQTCFYVDDFIYSTDCVKRALQTRTQVTEVLLGGGFPLAKWSGNLKELNMGGSTTTPETLLGDVDGNALGVKLNWESDEFQFNSPITASESCTTKRHIASASARIFDPLGMIGPIVVVAKMILQEAHRVEKKWDVPLPEEIITKWRAFVLALQSLHKISVPRWISSMTSPARVELHMFADASQRAYGTCAYLVSKDAGGNSCSRLLTAKCRVAPIDELTIPRLELCGALLATQLAEKIRPIYCPDATFFWSDSMVVLHWINSPAENYRIFLSRRIKQIQSVTSSVQWRHVPTKENPADVISRGCNPDQLREALLWWNGPLWLTQSMDNWPPAFVHSSSGPEEASVLALVSNDIREHTILDHLLTTSSSLAKLQRVMVHCLKFILPRMYRLLSTTQQREMALQRLIFLDQSQNLPGLKHHLEKYGSIRDPNWRRLASLAPFVDHDKLIRVGGRLHHAGGAPYTMRHPILLPRSHLTDLIVEQEHLRQLHAPPTLLLASLRQKFWPLGGRNCARKIYRNCYRCFRANPQPVEQLMADLPTPRVVYTRPFQLTGVDYAGPIQYRPSVPRGAAQRKMGLLKGYISVFVCMATKAVHLEFVTSLSTEAFLAAFRRFAARRTAPRHVYSDCGTNFEGAARELVQLLHQEESQRQITEEASQSGVIWHFNPPRAPHHGGLWEACVKSVKYHLSRIAQHTALSYEEFCTTLCQIESILNSRPIGLTSEDPNDLSYLTPGHFLTGVPGNSLPDPDVGLIPPNRLTLWQLCQQQAQEFGKKFRLLYLNTLQQRSKWKTDQPNITPNEVVLFLDETQYGAKWVLGQVEAILPGKDDRVRVITVRTPRGVYTRSITKIARLPTRDFEAPCSSQSDDHLEHPGENVGDGRLGNETANSNVNCSH